MGCDIHIVQEVKIGGKWHAFNQPYVDRNYDLFGFLANVRRDPEQDEEPISLPRGLPSDMSAVTKAHAEYWDADAHSKSWIVADEIKRVYEFLKRFGYTKIRLQLGYFWEEFGTEDWRYANIEDIRWVFWFDN